MNQDTDKVQYNWLESVVFKERSTIKDKKKTSKTMQAERINQSSFFSLMHLEQSG